MKPRTVIVALELTTSASIASLRRASHWQDAVDKCAGISTETERTFVGQVSVSVAQPASKRTIGKEPPAKKSRSKKAE